MAANVSTNRAETTASGRVDAGRVPVGRQLDSTAGHGRGGLHAPAGGRDHLASAPLLHASGWPAAVLVVGGASVLTAGIGLLAAPAHAEHLRSRRGGDRLGRSRGHGGRG
jgi:hypothetical protein